MAAIAEDFLAGDDLDLILVMLEEDIPIDNEDFVAEVDSFLVYSVLKFAKLNVV